MPRAELPRNGRLGTRAHRIMISRTRASSSLAFYVRARRTSNVVSLSPISTLYIARVKYRRDLLEMRVRSFV